MIGHQGVRASSTGLQRGGHQGVRASSTGLQLGREAGLRCRVNSDQQ